MLTPGEADADAVPLVGGAEPEVVSGDGADFRGVEMRRDSLGQGAESAEGVDGMVSIEEVLGLQFVTAGRWCGVRTEVWQSLGPGAGDAGADGVAVIGWLVGVVVPGSAVQSRRRGWWFPKVVRSWPDPGLLPEFVDDRAGEIPDEADTVGAGHHVVEGREHIFPRGV